METNKIIQGDCIQELHKLPDNSVDLILTDPPYNQTNLDWDCEFDLKEFWNQVNRIRKKNTAVIIFCKQPFTSKLLLSNQKMFRYELIWEKTRGSNNFQIRKQPIQIHENILVFYEEQPVYNDLMYDIPDIYVDKRKAINNSKYTKGHYTGVMTRKKDEGKRHPFSVLPFNSEWNRDMHPTQKPLLLFEWLIKSYSKKGSVILDMFAGSGTLAEACLKNGRNFIVIEKEASYIQMIKKRIKGLL